MALPLSLSLSPSPSYPIPSSFRRRIRERGRLNPARKYACVSREWSKRSTNEWTGSLKNTPEGEACNSIGFVYLQFSISTRAWTTHGRWRNAVTFLPSNKNRAMGRTRRTMETRDYICHLYRECRGFRSVLHGITDGIKWRIRPRFWGRFRIERIGRDLVTEKDFRENGAQ